MVYCSECGKELKKDSNFCDKCGKKSGINVEDEIFKNIKDFTKKTGNNIEKNAEHFGRRMEDFGKRIEKRFDRSTKNFEKWHDQYFGIFGPLVGSFLGLIIFRIIIELMALDPTGFPILAKTSELLYPYQLLFFGLMLLSSYSNYFSRRYTLFKLVSPIPSTIGFIVGIWVFSTIYNELYEFFENFPDFTIISNFIINNIAILFVIVLVLAYIVNLAVFFNLYSNKNKEET